MYNKEKLLANGDQWESLIAATFEADARYRQGTVGPDGLHDLTTRGNSRIARSFRGKDRRG
jgi:hypothetical protein